MTAVNHAYDALCRLRAKPYDLILSDVHMPHMDGFELLRQINQEFCLPVIREFLLSLHLWVYVHVCVLYNYNEDKCCQLLINF